MFCTSVMVLVHLSLRATLEAHWCVRSAASAGSWPGSWAGARAAPDSTAPASTRRWWSLPTGYGSRLRGRCDLSSLTWMDNDMVLSMRNERFSHLWSNFRLFSQFCGVSVTVRTSKPSPDNYQETQKIHNGPTRKIVRTGFYLFRKWPQRRLIQRSKTVKHSCLCCDQDMKAVNNNKMDLNWI